MGSELYVKWKEAEHKADKLEKRVAELERAEAERNELAYLVANARTNEGYVGTALDKAIDIVERDDFEPPSWARLTLGDLKPGSRVDRVTWLGEQHYELLDDGFFIVVNKAYEGCPKKMEDGTPIVWLYSPERNQIVAGNANLNVKAALGADHVEELEQHLPTWMARAQKAEARCRKAAQILIEEIGAPGPESVVDTARRAVGVIRNLEGGRPGDE